MTRRSSLVHCNGDVVARLRLRHGLTQEELAAKGHVSVRTVQRAEKGAWLQRRSAEKLRSALKARMTEIMMENAHEVSALKEANTRELVLPRITSGTALFEIVHDSFSGKMSCDIDGDFSVLLEAIEDIEAFAPDSWEVQTPMALSKRVRAAAILSRKLKALEAIGISVFAGTYSAKRPIPQSDLNGDYHVNDSFPLEVVTLYRVAFTKSNSNSLVVRVSD